MTFSKVLPHARRLKLGVLGAALGLAACAAPSQKYLDQARDACLTGNSGACQALPELSAQVNRELEAQHAQANAAAAAFTAALVTSANIYAASHPVYVEPVVVCRGWGCW